MLRMHSTFNTPPKKKERNSNTEGEEKWWEEILSHAWKQYNSWRQYILSETGLQPVMDGFYFVYP